MLPHSITLDQKTGGLTLSAGENHIVLHPLWIRERVSGDGFFDPISRQRLYEHAEFSDTLRVTNIISQSDTGINLDFSDGVRCWLNSERIFQEIGWLEASDSIADPKSWNAALETFPEVDWECLEDPKVIKGMLEDYFKYGFCIFQNTPTHRDSLKLSPVNSDIYERLILANCLTSKQSPIHRTSLIQMLL